ncbi:MAG: hypothetical protein HeimC3_24370 [Candidatus Heimdallarchaeota archaeon LC_3]|nr:MAG: hypothetical protein HeimC3_24370 [Candidatus Heimdallarchaeota archaeon LC_3]
MFDITKKINLSFDEAYEKTVNAFKEQGFGVLTEINVKDTFKKKLDIEFDRYTILGVCNPPFAHQVLEHDRKIGLLLPCNVCIWESDNQVTISAINPVTMFTALIQDKKIEGIAQEVKERINKAMDAI